MDDQQPISRFSEPLFECRRRTGTLIAALALAAITVLLYGTACRGWWHADDAAHLCFVLRYDRIWQYFALPAVSRAFSEAGLVPWAAMLYRLIFVSCGMEHPGAAYGMQLFAIFAAAWMTRLLLGLWIRPAWAWLGALLFLLGAPVMHAAHELMTIHYVQGLFFALAAAYGFARSLRSRSWWPAMAGGFCYLIAVTNKEIYVPLPVILLFLPESAWKQRLGRALPFLIVMAAYLPWRWFMLGGLVGGYQPQTLALNIGDAGRALCRIPTMLLGADAFGRAAVFAGLAGIILLAGLDRRKLTFGIVGLLVLLAPLAPLTNFPGLVAPDRYLLAVWWAMAAGCALIMERLGSGRPWRSWLALALWAVIGLAAGREMLAERRRLQPWLACYETQGRFLWTASSGRIFLVRPPFHVARYFAVIKRRLHGKDAAPIVIDDQADLAIQTRLGLVNGVSSSNAPVWAYNETRQRMETVTAEFRLQPAEARALAPEAPLRIDLQFERQILHWRLGPYEQGRYLMVRLIEGGILDRINFPPQGRRDAAGGGIFDFFMRYDAPAGWTTYSPILHFDRRAGGIVWRRE